MRGALVIVFAVLGCKSGSASGTATYNVEPDEGPIEPTLLVEAARPGTNDIRMVRFTPDGRWLLALDDTIGVWELDAKAKSLRERGWFGLAADRNEPDIRGGITQENAFAIQAQIEEWKKNHEGIEDFELLPNDQLVACGDAGTLSLWQLQLGSDPPAKRIAQQSGVGKDCFGITASADGRWVASYAWPTDEQKRSRPDETTQGAIVLWSVEARGALTKHATLLVEDRPSEGVFLPDGGHLLVVGSSQSLWPIQLDGSGGATLVHEPDMDDSCEDIALVPGTNTLLFGGFSQQITRWDVGENAALRLRHAYHQHQAKVRDVVPSPDGRFFVASSPDKTISIWPLGHADDEIPTPVVFTPSDDYVYGVDLHPGGPYLATAGQELRIWKINRGLLAAGNGTTKSTVVRKWAGETSVALVELAWTSDDALVTTMPDGSMQSWTIDGDALVRGEAGSVAKRDELTRRASAGDCMVVAGADGSLEARRKDGTIVAKHDLGLTSISAIALDAARVLVAGSAADNVGRLSLFRFDATACDLVGAATSIGIPQTPSGNVLSSVSYPGGGGAPPRAIAFSADGRSVLTGDGSGAGALLWRIDPAQGLVHTGQLLGHNAGAHAVAFAPDGRHAITAGNDGEVILHRLDPAIERLEYLDPPAMPAFFSYAAAWSPSGNRVAVSGGWGPHGRVWIFELDLSRRS